MDGFTLNGYFWRIEEVDPEDERLVDRTGTLTVATTDPRTMTIYLSKTLGGYFRDRVLIHEISHAALLSYGLLRQLHMYVRKEDWIDAEEWLCNYIANYGKMIFEAAGKTVKNGAVRHIPKELDRVLSNKGR